MFVRTLVHCQIVTFVVKIVLFYLCLKVKVTILLNSQNLWSRFQTNISTFTICVIDYLLISLDRFNLLLTQGQVYMYYGLTNFYQNHRRYVKSRDDNQLRGEQLSGNNLVGDCTPYKTGENETAIAPCGAIANSLFNGRHLLQPSEMSHVFCKASLIVYRTDVFVI